MKYILMIGIVLALVSCKKDPLRKMTGEYSCEATSNYWMLGEPTQTTVYVDTFTVLDVDNFIYINGIKTYNRDSIVADEWYNLGYYPSFAKFKFAPDSLYYYTSGGGLGGGSSTSRSCVKM